MKQLRWMAVGALMLVSACVSTSDFEAYKTATKADEDLYRAKIKADGDALDAWVKAAHDNIIWLRQSVIKLCPSCTPPTAPPSPPPDGNWGI